MTNFQRCLEALIGNDVRFVLIGGLAAIAHGSSYITRDVDVCYDRGRDNLERIAAALAPFHPRLRGFPADLPFVWNSATLANCTNVTLNSDIGAIDFAEVSGVGTYSDAVADAINSDFFGRSCVVLSLDALIRSKRAAGRTKDLLLVPELEAIKELQDLDPSNENMK